MQDDDVTAYARLAIDTLEGEKRTVRMQLAELDRMLARQPGVPICGTDQLVSLEPEQRAIVMEALYERERHLARRSGLRRRLESVEAEVAHWSNRLIMTGRILPVVAVLVLMLFPMIAQANCYHWPLREQGGVFAYDGDTIYITMPGLPAPISKMSVRVAGIDTPEIRGQCEAEKQLAIMARDRVRALLARAVTAGQPVLFCRPEWGRYGGRVVAHVAIGDAWLHDILLAEGLGRVYQGGQRSSWCPQ
ncbi:thermonuclease family protein [Thalassospira sp.]|uniref:thermonuclease family protein n=1 Tax=Thalassospira sp. TaxID=1912094 RepID=UPI0027374C26|nr:hypothetical protein [Thalassospira sp.]MDP2697152.1 hypothetical protein [Thalassospira sp.]